MKRFTHSYLLCLVLHTPLQADTNPATNRLSEVEFTAFDIETTGLSAKHHYIIEIGAVRFRNTNILNEASWLIRPPIPVPERATRIHGITTDNLADATNFNTVLTLFNNFSEDSILLAHNAAFDTRFIQAELNRAGLSTNTFLCVDTLPLFREWLPNLKSYGLGALAEHHKKPFEKAHRARADAHMLAEMFIAQQARWTTNTYKGLMEKTRKYPRGDKSIQRN